MLLPYIYDLYFIGNEDNRPLKSYISSSEALYRYLQESPPHGSLKKAIVYVVRLYFLKKQPFISYKYT